MRGHLTETSVLSVHNHIIKALSFRQLTCPTLLDLTVVFDAIYHSILLERLSFVFGITLNALSWIKSYLPNLHFSVNIEGSQSSSFQVLYDFPQGSVLGPLLSILYTSLNKVISNSPSSHKLYAGDSQLFREFSASCCFSFNTILLTLNTL